MASMPIATDQADEDLEAVLADYLRAAEDGRAPERMELLARHPDLAPELAAFFAGQERFTRLAAPLRDAVSAAQQSTIEDKLAEGGRLGDFRLLREVGRGGMGIVYEAEQISLGRKVALKILPFAGALDAKQLQRFKNEAHAAAHLQHQNIVPVYFVGCERGVHFYAMQFVEGQTLAALIQELRQASQKTQSPSPLGSPPIDPQPTGPYTAEPKSSATIGEDSPEAEKAAATVQDRDALIETVSAPTRSSILDSPSSFFHTVANLGIQAAEALEHAHQLGVIHRDIKPANLMVENSSPLAPRGRGDGGEGVRLWITDFGLAHCQGGCELTMSGDLLGTLRYMSPEQALAKRVIVDERTDIYSLGVTLYELLTLEAAFPGTDRQEVLRQIAFDDPKPPRRFNKAIPTELETIILKAMEKNPADRYGTAKELAEDLQHFLDDKPIRARRPTFVQRFRKWARRHPGVVRTAIGAFFTAVLILAVSTGLILFQLHRTEVAEKDQRQARLDAEVAEEKATKNMEKAQTEEREKTQKLWQEKLARAAANRLSRHAGQRFESLKVLAEAAQIARDLKMPEENFLELRNEAIACLAMPDLRVAEGEKAWEVGNAQIDFDGNLERYVRVDQQGNVSVRRLADDGEIYHFPSGIGPASPQIASDGRFLAMSASATTVIWNLTGPKPALVLRTVLPRGCNLAFTADSRRLAISRPNGSLHLYELPSARLLKELTVDPSANSLAFNPKKNQLAVGCSSRLQIIDLDSGQLTAEFPTTQCPHGSHMVCWNPDGKSLAAASWPAVILIWDVPTGKQIGRLECRKEDIILAYSHRGNLLASTGWDGMLRLWDPRTGQELVSTQLRLPFLRFSRDDRLLGAGVQGGKLRFWEVHANREYRTLAFSPVLDRAGYGSSTISADNRLIAAGMAEGFGLWDLTTGSPLSFVPAPGGTPLVSFESSGALLTGGDVRRDCPNFGLFRWPVHVNPKLPSLRHFGPPQKIAIPASAPHQIAANWNEWAMAIDRARGAFALDPNRPDWLVVPRPHAGTGLIIALSGDGRWVAAGADTTGFNYEELMVWDANSGKFVKKLGYCPFNDLSPPGSCLAFSPDSQWLAIGAYGSVRVWEVGSWREQAHFQVQYSPVTFSPDSKMLAFEAGGAIRLVAPDTGREYARLEDPNQNQAWSIRFSPDGTHLVTNNRDGEPIHVWDLRAIREQLASMDLDWDLPSYPPAAINLDSKPLQVEVHAGELMDREKYSLIIALFPFHAEAYYQRGLAYARSFQWEQASSDFTMAAALRPDHAETHYQRGLMQVRQGQSQKAVGDFSRAIELRPKYGDAHAGRAEAYAAAQQWDRAIADFSQALENKGDDPNLWFGRGKAYSKLGQWQKASLDFSKTIELDPDWHEAWHLRGRAYSGMGQWEKAVVDLSKAEELLPCCVSAWSERGAAYSALGQWDKAFADLSKAIDLNPRELSFWIARGLAYAESAQWDKADADFAKADELVPDNMWCPYMRAFLRLARGDSQGYRKACAALLESSAPKPIPEADNWVAWTCVLLPDAVKELDRPVKLAEGALRSDPNNHSYSQTLGATLYRAGRFAEAVRRLEETNNAWEQDPNKLASYCPGYTHFFLAMSHHRLGHAQKASQWLDKASKWIDREMQNPANQASSAWNRRLTLHLFQREAEDLLHGPAKPNDKSE